MLPEPIPLEESRAMARRLVEPVWKVVVEKGDDRTKYDDLAGPRQCRSRGGPGEAGIGEVPEQDLGVPDPDRGRRRRSPTPTRKKPPRWPSRSPTPPSAPGP